MVRIRAPARGLKGLEHGRTTYAVENHVESLASSGLQGCGIVGAAQEHHRISQAPSTQALQGESMAGRPYHAASPQDARELNGGPHHAATSLSKSMPNSSSSSNRATLRPDEAVTPPPGCVLAPAMNSPSTGERYCPYPGAGRFPAICQL